MQGKKPAALEKVRGPGDAGIHREVPDHCVSPASGQRASNGPLPDGDGQGELRRSPGHIQVGGPRGDTLDASCKNSLQRRAGLSGPGDAQGSPGRSAARGSPGWRENHVREEQSTALAELKSKESDDHSGHDGRRVGGLPRLSRDFKVKGKLIEDDEDSGAPAAAASLNSAGHVRHIHFPFSLPDDSAFSVASEMVEELGLTDQDVREHRGDDRPGDHDR